MKEVKVKISCLQRVAPGIFLLGFKSRYLSKTSGPGNFLQIDIGPQFSLNRPFSIHRVERHRVYILFKVRGQATRVLSQKKIGQILRVLGPLGKGFNLVNAKHSLEEIILVGGGIGVAPLYFLAQKLKIALPKTLLLGARTRSQVLLRQEFRKLGFKVFVSTEDGSLGFKGDVVSLLDDHLRRNSISSAKIYACGPAGMIESLKSFKDKGIDIEVSLESFMGCGIGICSACTIFTKNGLRKICKDGPVFNLKELV